MKNTKSTAKKSATKSRKAPGVYTMFYAYRHYLLAALVLAVVFLSMFVLVQQQARMQANDTPQLLATQVAKQLDADLGLESVNMGATDLANNPVPFVIMYDKQGKAVGGSGYLDSQLATIPKGVLEHTTDDPHAVTWEPASGVRLATVTVATKDYYVVGGQSLAQTEAHAQRLAIISAAGYLLTLILLGTYASLRYIAKRV